VCYNASTDELMWHDGVVAIMCRYAVKKLLTY